MGHLVNCAPPFGSFPATAMAPSRLVDRSGEKIAVLMNGFEVSLDIASTIETASAKSIKFSFEFPIITEMNIFVAQECSGHL